MKRSIAVVTGGERGIGRATVSEFAHHGYRVFSLDIVEGEALLSGARFIHADVSNEADVSRAFALIAEETDGLDVLVNNAGICHSAKLIDTNPEQWDRVMAVNVKSVYLVSRVGYPLLMKRPGASIVNVASVHACATSESVAPYAASKGAVLALTRAMALEMAHDGIRVNCVLPGAVDTVMLRGGVERGHLGDLDETGMLETLANRTPLKRIGTPEEIAKVIFFLASPETGAFVTGQSLVADGGALARLSTE
jgi:glucose 1-dehydrogenase